jgi:hypothetical protein
METKRHLIIGYDAKRMMCNDTGLGNYSRNLVNALIKADKDTEFRLYFSLRRQRGSESADPALLRI